MRTDQSEMMEASLSKSDSLGELLMDRGQGASVTPALETVKHNANSELGPTLTSCSPRDGGYGWVVVAAACMSHMFIVGFFKSYTLFYVEIISAYPNSSAYEVSWIAVMLNTVGLLLSPLTAALCNKFSCRTVSMMGGLCAFAGIFSASFATSVRQLVFTIGALTGFGMGAVTTSSILIISQYFNKKRSTACAICVSGNALGGFIMPLLLEYILHEYKLRGALLIISGLQLHIVIFSYLYRPVKKYALVPARKSSVTDHLYPAGENSAVPLNNTANSLQLKTAIPSHLPVDGHRQTVEHETGIGEELALYRAAVFMTNSAPNLNVLQTSMKHSHSLCKHEFEVQCQKCKPSSIRLNGSAQSASIRVFSYSNKRTRRVSESAVCFTRPQQSAENGERIRNVLQRKDDHQDDKPQNCSLMHSLLNKMPTPLGTSMTHIKLNIDKCDYIRTNALLRKNLKDSFCNAHNNCEHNCTCSNDAYKSVSLSYAESTPAKDPKSEQDLVLERSLKKTWRIIINILSMFESCFDTEVLKTAPMILMCLSAALLSMAAPQGLIYVHAYFTTAGIDSSLVTRLLSIASVADLVGRLTTGFMADSGLIPVHWLYFIWSVVLFIKLVILQLITVSNVVICA